MAPADRFFAATILGGRLHIRGIPDWGPWVILSDITGDRKAWIREELEAAMRESMGPTLHDTSGLTRAWRMKPTGYGSRWRLIANVPEQSDTADAARETVERRGYFVLEVNRDNSSQPVSF